MRNAFIKAMTDILKKNKYVMMLNGDAGYKIFQPISSKFKSQYINCGIAEANMVTVATGLAKSGYIPFTYAIGAHVVYRAFEQIRNDVCYHHLNVKIVSVGAGYSYGSLGYTHHGLEDIAVMRVMPGMKVIAPGDPIETKLATNSIAVNDGPFYLRLGKSGEKILHEVDPDFFIGKAIILQKGHDVTLISTGSILSEVVKASRLLEKDGISATIASMHTLKPIDDNFIQESMHSKLIVTVEEHSSIGGLGSAVADIVSQSNSYDANLLKINTGIDLSKEVGSQSWYRKQCGLNASSIYKTIRDKIDE